MQKHDNFIIASFHCYWAHNIDVPAVIIICPWMCMCRVWQTRSVINDLQRVCVCDLRIRCPCTYTGKCCEDVHISSRGNLLTQFPDIFFFSSFVHKRCMCVSRKIIVAIFFVSCFDSGIDILIITIDKISRRNKIARWCPIRPRYWRFLCYHCEHGINIVSNGLSTRPIFSKPYQMPVESTRASCCSLQELALALFDKKILPLLSLIFKLHYSP